MGLTANCDIFASISEGIFNKIVLNVARQRPSMFNYGTLTFVANPSLMCEPIMVAPGLPASQPRVTLEAPIPVPGTDGAWGMEYCAQLTRLTLDFHPGQSINLPPQLSPPLAAQTLAMQLQVCGGIACPDPRVLTMLGANEARLYPPIDPVQAIRGDDKRQEPPSRPPRPVPVERGRIHCFCLDLFALAVLRRDMGPQGPVLAVELKGLEIVDVKPDGLENSLECLMTTVIALGVLPRLRLALDAIILSLGEFGNLQIALTPTSQAVPFNPSIANDQLAVFVNVTV